MNFNTCETCGAGNGKAGNLFKNGDSPFECRNCRDTRESGAITLHSDLQRTMDEINRMAEKLVLRRITQASANTKAL